MKKVNFSMSKLVKTKNIFKAEIQNLEIKLKPFVDFEFFIDYQPSDGFVIVHMANSHNALLSNCICIIQEKGILIYEDYLDECI